MTKNSLLLQDETSEKYFRFSTRRITGIFIEKIILQLKKNKPKTILDVGCGTGYSLVLIRSEFPDAELHGIDIQSSKV